MNKNTKIKFSALFTASIVLVATVVGCSSDYNSTTAPASSSTAMGYSNHDSMMFESSAMPQITTDEELSFSKAQMDSAVSNTTTSSSTGEVIARKIIKNVYLELETKDFTNALSEIDRMVNEAGGYTSSKNISGGSTRYNDNYFEQSAYIIVKIPSGELDGFVGTMGELTHVVVSEESAQDVSDTYYDAERRKEVLVVQENTLIDLLAKAETLEQIITLEQRLSEIRYEIESIEAQLRNIDNSVAYSTVTMSLNEVIDYQPIEKEPETFWDRLSNASEDSIANLTYSLEAILFTIITFGPVFILQVGIFALVVFAIIKIILAIIKHYSKKNTPPPPVPQNTDNNPPDTTI